LKANHNDSKTAVSPEWIERTLTKIKVESKSQRALVKALVVYIERTLTKIKVESKSQLNLWIIFNYPH